MLEPAELIEFSERLEKLECSHSDITTASLNLVICLHSHGKRYADMTSQSQKNKSALIPDKGGDKL